MKAMIGITPRMAILLSRDWKVAGFQTSQLLQMYGEVNKPFGTIMYRIKITIKTLCRQRELHMYRLD